MQALQLDPGALAQGRPYAERHDPTPSWHDDAALYLWHGGVTPLLARSGYSLRAARRFCALVEGAGQGLATLSDEALARRFRAQAPVLRRT